MSFSVYLPPKWTQRDGTTIALSDMTSTHVLNCIAMLQRKHYRPVDVFPQLYPALLLEAVRRRIDTEAIRMEILSLPLYD